MTIKVGSKVLLSPFHFENEEVSADEPAQVGIVLEIGEDEMLIQLDEEFIDWEVEQDNGVREVPNDQITEIPE